MAHDLLTRKKFTVQEFERMGSLGLLGEDCRLELIDGDIVTMNPIGSPHSSCVDRLHFLLVQRTGRTAVVRAQNPIRLPDHSEPQPDLSVAKARADFYKAAHPTAEDLLLVIEVSDSTLAADREVKIPLYARHGVPETWIVNLPDAQIEAYRKPERGQYLQRTVYLTGQSVPLPDALGNGGLSVDEILG